MEFNKEYVLVEHDFNNVSTPTKVVFKFTALSIGVPMDLGLEYKITGTFIFDTTQNYYLPNELQIGKNIQSILNEYLTGSWGSSCDNGRRRTENYFSKKLNIKEIFDIEKENYKKIVNIIQNEIDKFHLVKTNAEKECERNIYFKDKNGKFCSKKEFIFSEPILELCSVTPDPTLAETVLNKLESINIDYIKQFVYAMNVPLWLRNINDGANTNIQLQILKDGNIKANKYGCCPWWSDTQYSKHDWIEMFKTELEKRINKQKMIVDALNSNFVEEEN